MKLGISPTRLDLTIYWQFVYNFVKRKTERQKTRKQGTRQTVRKKTTERQRKEEKKNRTQMLDWLNFLSKTFNESK